MRMVMDMLQGPLAHATTQALGWTLLHFVWQGMLVATALWCALGLLPERSPGARYAAGCAALAAMALFPLLTFSRLEAVEYRRALAMMNAPVDLGALAIQATATGPAGSWFARFAGVLNQELPWIMLAWCAGVVVFSCRLLTGLAVTRGWKLRETAAVPEPLQTAFRSLCARVGVDRPVRLVHSARVHVPTVIGWIKPAILIPAGFVTGMSQMQLEALLAHELAHVRRGDYLVNMMQSVVEVLLYYHPAVWWVSRQVRRERECCCDEFAVRACGDRLAYAKALSVLEERRALLPQLELAANGGVLTMRIKRLLGTKEEAAPSRLAWLAVLAVVFASGGPMIARLARAESKGPGQPAAASRPSAVEGEGGGNGQAQAEGSQQKSEQTPAGIPAQSGSGSLPEVENMEAVRRAVDAELKKIDSPEFRQQLDALKADGTRADREEMRRELEAMRLKLNSPEFRKQIEQVKRQAELQARSMKELNSAELKKQMVQAEQAAHTLNSPEMQRLIQDARKQALELQGLQARIRAELSRPEFKKQVDEAVRDANSPEMQRLIQDARKQLAVLNTPEFRERMGKIAQEAGAVRAGNPSLASNGGKGNGSGTGNGSDGSANAAPAVNGPVRVSAGVMAGQVMTQVNPVYPDIARAAHVGGTVVLTAIIGKAGDVEQLRVVSGAPMLVQSAIDAVRQWKYKPYLLNGQPVEVLTTINVNYTFGEGTAPEQLPQGSGGGSAERLMADGASSPQVIYKVEPEYTEPAREAKTSGSVIVHLTVDERGLPQDVSVLRGIGNGLDEKAVEAVKQYRFKPAMKDGVAVAEAVNVEVNFKIF